MKRLIGVLGLLMLLASPVLAADATLTWNANTESDLAGYKLFRGQINCSAAGPLQPLVKNGSDVQVGKVTTYFDAGLPAIDGTICYEIKAYDTAGNVSPASNRVSKALNAIPPVAPTGLDAAITQ